MSLSLGGLTCACGTLDAMSSFLALVVGLVVHAARADAPPIDLVAGTTGAAVRSAALGSSSATPRRW